MHLETFLYMLLQSDKTLPPNNLNPDFEGMAENAKLNEGHDWIYVPEVHLERGLEDEENDDGPERFFGWDNEKPRRKIHVKAFESRPKVLTNGDYAMFLENTGKSEVGLWSRFGALALVLITADSSLLDRWLPSWRSRGWLDDEWTLWPPKRSRHGQRIRLPPRQIRQDLLRSCAATTGARLARDGNIR